MFIISLTYTQSLESIDQHLEAHVAFLKEQYAKGLFIASGRKVPRSGGVILAVSDSKEMIEQTITQDPFYIHALADYEITEFVPSMTSADFSAFANR